MAGHIRSFASARAPRRLSPRPPIRDIHSGEPFAAARLAWSPAQGANGDQADSNCSHYEHETDEVCIDLGVTEPDCDVFLAPSLASIEDEEEPGKPKQDPEEKPEQPRDESHPTESRSLPEISGSRRPDSNRGPLHYERNPAPWRELAGCGGRWLERSRCGLSRVPLTAW